MGGLKPPSKNALWALFFLCAGIELILQAADYGLIGHTRLRQLFVEYGGFWPGLWGNWRPNFTMQPWSMFITYGFLHAGMGHFVVNMITLWSIGSLVLQRVRTGRFLLIYGLSIIGGAVGFTLLVPDFRPMVGASGALFGLIGSVLAWRYVDLFTENQTLWPVAQAVGGLVLLNLVMWWAMSGQLAWQTHLGGFVVGWITALLVDPRPQPLDDIDPSS